tara:strand:- start:206 stop:466 length:261 start_codon:yes stop_codon:yes gene_type:complete
MEEDKEEKRWYVSEDSITEFVNKNKHRFSTNQTNWSMTIYTLLFICALLVVGGVGLMAVIAIFVPVYVVFAPAIFLEKYFRKDGQQ